MACTSLKNCPKINKPYLSLYLNIRAEFYQCIVLDQSENQVSGFVFFSENLEQHWQPLDEFEGAGYQRVPVKAHLNTGEIIDSFVYALNH